MNTAPTPITDAPAPQPNSSDDPDTTALKGPHPDIAGVIAEHADTPLGALLGELANLRDQASRHNDAGAVSAELERNADEIGPAALVQRVALELLTGMRRIATALERSVEDAFLLYQPSGEAAITVGPRELVHKLQAAVAQAKRPATPMVQLVHLVARAVAMGEQQAAGTDNKADEQAGPFVEGVRFTFEELPAAGIDELTKAGASVQHGSRPGAAVCADVVATFDKVAVDVCAGILQSGSATMLHLQLDGRTWAPVTSVVSWLAALDLGGDMVARVKPAELEEVAP